MGKSISVVDQYDSSIQNSGDTDSLLGVGANQANPFSVITGEGTTLGNLTITQFPDSLNSTIDNLINGYDRAVEKSQEVQLAATSALSNSLSNLQIGETSIVPKIALYSVIGIVALVIGKALIK